MIFIILPMLEFSVIINQGASCYFSRNLNCGHGLKPVSFIARMICGMDFPMTQKVTHAFESTIRRGEPRSVRYYETIADQVLQNCRPDDDFLLLYPFGDEVDSRLGYAVWRLRVDRIRNAQNNH